MYLGKVIGNVVSTTKSEKLTGLKLLLIQQIDMLTMKAVGTPVVIADTVGAGVGEVVMVVTGGSARLTEQTTGKPVDASIIGIIDTVEMDGEMLFQKYPPKEEVKVQKEISVLTTEAEPKQEAEPDKEESPKKESADIDTPEEPGESKEESKPDSVKPEKDIALDNKKQLLEKVTKKQKH